MFHKTKKNLMEKNSPSSRATKSSFVRRLANFGNVSLFSSSGNKHIFRAYPSTLKIAKLCFETTATHSRIIWSAQLSFLLLWGTGTGFVGVLPLLLIFDLPENTTLHTETMLKTALQLLDTAFTTRFKAKCQQ